MSAHKRPTALDYGLVVVAVFGGIAALPYAVKALLYACAWFGL